MFHEGVEYFRLTPFVSGDSVGFAACVFLCHDPAGVAVSLWETDVMIRATVGGE